MRLASRVKETSTTTGLGTLDLDGAESGFQTFVAGVGDGVKTAYMLIHGTAWERGIGTVTDAAPDTLSRDTVLESSTGAKLNLGSGTKTLLVASGPDTFVHGGHIHGLELSNNAVDADHDIDIASGEAASDDAGDADRVLLELFSTLVKQIDASWAAGNNAGGLSSSLTLTADTWYHVFLIRVGGKDDVGFDTSVTGANLIADHSATHVRLLGSRLTDASANILPTYKVGGFVGWVDPPLDVDDSASGTAANTATISTPLGREVEARLNCYVTSVVSIYVSPLDADDEVPSDSAAPLGTYGTAAGVNLSQVTVKTNTSSQIRYRTSSTETVRMVTLGWMDRPGVT